MDTDDAGVPTARLYASAIAVVSGGYAALLGLSASAGRIDAPLVAWLLTVVGVVALVHGVVLLTPAATRLGAASGPLVVGYAVVMFLLQAWGATGLRMGAMDGRMDGGPGGMSGAGGTGSTTAGSMGGTGLAMQWDAGLAALALLLLASGALMVTRRGEMGLLTDEDESRGGGSSR